MRHEHVRRLVFRMALGALWLLGILAITVGCKSLFLSKGYPEYGGEVTGLPLHAPVRVLRDAHGIPHIYAQDRHDLMVAQGYVHAQDRLWQMETLRRVAAGTLSEIAFALQMRKPVIGIGTWDIRGVIRAVGASDAVEKAFEQLMSRMEE